MPTATIRIEAKTHDAAGAARTLRRVLAARRRTQVTTADAAALSGLPLRHCEAGLLHLASRYPCHLNVNDDGGITFQFTDLSAPHRSLRWRWVLRVEQASDGANRFIRDQGRRILAAVMAWSLSLLYLAFLGNDWALITQSLQQSLTLADALNLHPEQGIGHLPHLAMPLLMLLGLVTGAAALYFGWLIPFAALYPLFCVSLVASGFFFLYGYASDGSAVAWVGRLVLGPILIAFGGAALANRGDAWTPKGARKPTDAAEVEEYFWETIEGAWFGPRQEASDVLADERRLTALIQANRQVLTAGDLMTLFGWTKAEADSELTRILVDYGGEVVVSDDGGLCYHFDSLSGATAAADADLTPIDKRPPRLPAYWGSSPYLGYWLLAACVCGPVGLWLQPGASLFHVGLGWRQAGWVEGLGIYPYICAAIPLLLRLPGWSLRRRRMRQIRRRVPLLETLRLKPAGEYYERVRADDLAALGGTLDPERTTAEGHLWVEFPDQVLAAAAADGLRGGMAEVGDRPPD